MNNLRNVFYMNNLRNVFYMNNLAVRMTRLVHACDMTYVCDTCKSLNNKHIKTEKEREREKEKERESVCVCDTSKF